MESVIVDGVKVTHPNKLLFINPALNKLEVIDYYKKVSKLFIKEVKDRPISMVRMPEGIKGQRFFQKHPTESFPEFIERVKIKEKEETGIYITIDDFNDIVYLLNIGVLEFHIWGSKIEDIERPDRLIFDLDPSPGNTINDLRELASTIKELLEVNGYKPLIKTSGSKGFHIFADVYKHKYSWEELKTLSKVIAERIVSYNPKKYTIEFSKKNRGNRIFIDYLRNERGSTMVAAYSLRSKEGAPISFPFDWKDLEKITPTFFTVKNVSKYL